MYQDIKTKIRGVVDDYIKNYPEDYHNVKVYVKALRENRISDTGDMSRMSDTIQRPIVEFPELLDKMIQTALTDDEFVTFTQDPKHVLIRWFARTFPEFKAIEKV